MVLHMTVTDGHCCGSQNTICLDSVRIQNFVSIWIRNQFGYGSEISENLFHTVTLSFWNIFLTMMVPCIRSSLLSMIHLQKEKTNIKCPIYSRVANWGIRIHKVVVYRSNLDPDIHNWGWVQLFGRKNQQKKPFLFKTRKVLILLNNRKRA